MCQCNPAIRTPFCGKGECVWPKQLEKQSEGFDPSKEEGLTPSAVVTLAKVIIEKDPIVIMWNGDGFVAMVGGQLWSPYGILSELLEDIGKSGSK